MLQLTNISKHFGPVAALDNVTLSLRQGAIHGILGENGAGKSTLMNILFGLARPDTGKIEFDGRRVRIASPVIAQRLGIGMVHQHFKLVESLTVLENISLAAVRGLWSPGRRELIGRIRIWTDRLHWNPDLEKPVADLSVGQRQRVEIVKALCTGGKLLILDEPTAVLAPQEVAELIPALRAVAAAGMAVLFISHKLAEVQKLCDRITILRKGRVVYTGSIRELDAGQIAEKMIGARLKIPHLADHQEPPGEAPRWDRGELSPPRLELRNVSVRSSHQGAWLLFNVNLSVRSGEIHGIAGVDGNGQDCLVRCILGQIEPVDGNVIFGDSSDSHRKTPGINPRSPLGCIPEDRQREALVLPLSVQANLMLKRYHTSPFSWMGLCRFGRWRQRSAELIRQFDIRCPDAQTPVGMLSGGNQQKVVVARELGEKPRIILAVNPTRGLDVGASAFVMKQLLAARRDGAAILLVHSDLDELLAISDRVSVLYNGQLQETSWPDASREQIGKMMLGVA
jgi:simple sugar transport system ATP-binding protein